MNRRLLLPACLFLATAVSSIAQDAAAGVKATTPDQRKEKWCQERHAAFNEVSKKGEAELVFLGDSITQGWGGGGKAVWEKYYSKRKAAEFGVSGDRTENVLWRLENGNFDGLKPKLIVIMIGTNNTGHRKDPAEQTAAGVKAILERLGKKCPDSKVLLLGVFPRGEKPDDPMRKINEQINAIIAKCADGKKIFYKDIAAKFLKPDGMMINDIMPDKLHPNAKGYEVWAEAIEEDVARLLGEKAKS
jgi:lysophospholipase L1-like esterase